jgi:hypothetical protein
VFDKNYTTISQVLSDTTTLQTLISSNNANDYLVRSTSWVSNVCGNSTAMSYIGLNNYSANTLLADSTWCTAICNSTYFESVLNVKIPTMTSNTTPSGTCGAKTNSDTAYRAFNPNEIYTSGMSNNQENQYVEYTFSKAFTPYVCTMTISHSTYGKYEPSAIAKVHGFNTDNTLDTFTSQTINFPNPEGSSGYQSIGNVIVPATYRLKKYAKYRFEVIPTTSTYRPNQSFKYCQIYGRADV